MNVFVVYEYEEESGEVIGVFSTFDMAKLFGKQNSNKHGNMFSYTKLMEKK